MNYSPYVYSKRAFEIQPENADLVVSPVYQRTDPFKDINEPFIRKIQVNTSNAARDVPKTSPQYIAMFDPSGYFGYDVFLPCNKCEGCQVRKRAIISTKFDNCMKKYPHAYFLTITFSNKEVTRLVNYQNEGNDSFNTMLSKYDVKRILANLRNKLKRRYNLAKNPKFDYLICGEYGPKTLRAHYHIALFLPFELPDLKVKSKDKLTCPMLDSKQYGFYDLEKIKPGSCVSQYITKYMTKSFEAMSVELARKGKPIAKLSLAGEQKTLRFSKDPYMCEDLKFQAPFLIMSRRFGLNDDLRKDIDQGILSYYHKRRYIFEGGKIKDQELYKYYHTKQLEKWRDNLGKVIDGVPSKLVIRPAMVSDPF